MKCQWSSGKIRCFHCWAPDLIPGWHRVYLTYLYPGLPWVCILYDVCITTPSFPGIYSLPVLGCQTCRLLMEQGTYFEGLGFWYKSFLPPHPCTSCLYHPLFSSDQESKYPIVKQDLLFGGTWTVVWLACCVVFWSQKNWFETISANTIAFMLHCRPLIHYLGLPNRGGPFFHLPKLRFQLSNWFNASNIYVSR